MYCPVQGSWSTLLHFMWCLFFVSLFLLVFVFVFFMGGREEWVYRTNLSPTFFFIDVLVPSHGSGRYLCVWGFDFLSF